MNVTQEHNHLSRDGLYVDSAFTRTAATNLRRDLNFNGTILGSVYARPLYVENGPGGAAMIIVTTETNDVYALNAGTGNVIWHRNVGAPVISGLLCGTINPLGITGTPGRRSCVPVFVLRCDDRRRHDQTFNFLIERGHRRDPSGWPWM